MLEFNRLGGLVVTLESFYTTVRVGSGVRN